MTPRRLSSRKMAARYSISGRFSVSSAILGFAIFQLLSEETERHGSRATDLIVHGHRQMGLAMLHGQRPLAPDHFHHTAGGEQGPLQVRRPDHQDPDGPEQFRGLPRRQGEAGGRD